MGIDDMLKQQIRDRAPELKQKLVAEFSEVTKRTWTRQATTPTTSSIVFRKRLVSPASRSSSGSIR